MPVHIVIAAFAVALSVPVMWCALSVDRVPGRRVDRNLLASRNRSTDQREAALSVPRVERILQPLLGALRRPVRRLSPRGIVTNIERRLKISGSTWSLERVLLVKLALCGAFLAAGVAYALATPSTMSFVVAATAGLAGYLTPDLVLARKAASRQLAISNKLPDTLDQLTICVEAGLGFDAAMARVCRSGRGPLAEELIRLLQDLRVGVPRPEALDALLARTDVPELRQFVHAVIQAESYGVSISRVLRTPGDRAAGEAAVPGRGAGHEAAGEGDHPDDHVHPADALHHRPRPGLHPVHDHDVALSPARALIRTGSLGWGRPLCWLMVMP